MTEITVATMLASIRHALTSLGSRAAADATGEGLLNDCREILIRLELAEYKPPTRDQLLLLANRVADIHERRVDYVLNRTRCEHDSIDVDLTALEVSRTLEAYEGPRYDRNSVTLESCEACSECELCEGHRMVTTTDNLAWRIRKRPKGT